jgi:hypothetical protein
VTGYPECITQPVQPRVALLVDYPVLMRAVRAINPDAVPRLGDIVSRARDLGAVVVSRAYGAWYDVDEATNAFTEGLDPRFVPSSGPGNVPTTSMLVSEGTALIEQGLVDAIALSGDDRLLPVVAAAYDANLPVVLVAHACLPEGPCLPLVDDAFPVAEFSRSMSRAERYRRPSPAA